MKNEMILVIKNLVVENILPLDREGAAGWIHDSKLWLVSKRFLDEFRNEAHRQDLIVPRDNSDLMSSLNDEGLLLKYDNERLIHKITVVIALNEGEERSNNFTCLCIPIKQLGSENEIIFQQKDNIVVLNAV